MKDMFSQECFCRQNGQYINCSQYDGARTKMINNDFKGAKKVPGSIEDCVYGITHSINLGAKEMLKQFGVFQFISNEELAERQKTIELMKDDNFVEMKKAGLPTDQIIFTA